MVTKIKKKGIYCIEGHWENNIADKSSVKPILDLLEKRGLCDHIYHDCATIGELEFYLSKWKNNKKVNEKFPILYLAFHGNEGCIVLPDKKEYSLENLSEFLEGKCKDKIIHFGSCLTFKIHLSKIKSLLKKTGAIAAIGYKTEVDWIQSTACDLFIFEALQKHNYHSKGIKEIELEIKREYGNLHKKLELRVVMTDEYRPRKRGTGCVKITV